MKDALEIPNGSKWLAKSKYSEAFKDALVGSDKQGMFKVRGDSDLAKTFTTEFANNNKRIHLDSAPSTGEPDVLARVWLLSLLRYERLLVAGLLQAIFACAMQGQHGLRINQSDGTPIHIYAGGVPKTVKEFAKKVAVRAGSCGMVIGGDDSDGGKIVCDGEQTTGTGPRKITTFVGASTTTFLDAVLNAFRSQVAASKTFANDVAPLAKLFPPLAKALEQSAGPTVAQVTTFLQHATSQSGSWSKANKRRLRMLEGALNKRFSPDGITTHMKLYETEVQVLPLNTSAVSSVYKSCATNLYAVIMQRGKSVSATQSWLGTFDAALDQMN